MKYKNIAIIAAKSSQEAIKRKNLLLEKYNFRDITADHTQIQDIDLVIAVGGDGLMLHLLHEYENKPVTVYGINCGTIGFLMNHFHDEDLLQAIDKAQESILHPLRMTATNSAGKKFTHVAINEVALLRQSSQAAKIRVKINGRERIKNLTADGILVATPAGSTAYNLSVKGPIIPFETNILALTPISPFRPRNWRGALLTSDSKIKIEVINHEVRPVRVTADFYEVDNIKEVEIFEDLSIGFKVLFDPNHSLKERIIQEQFED